MTLLREDWFEAERLIRAAQDGLLEEVQRLAKEGIDLDLMDELGHAALHYAVMDERYRVAEWLLENGANVNLYLEGLIGETPLNLAARGNYPEVVELLLRHGADPDIPGWMMKTARIRAHERRDDEGRKIAALIEEFKPSKPNPGSKRAK
jgi:ankyrin repeat protein